METLAKVVGVILGLVVLLAVIALVLALPTMWLWNWLMPEIFGLKAISFWEALGLNMLCGILFKNGSISKGED